MVAKPNIVEHVSEDFEVQSIELPDIDWLRKNFRSKSAMIRYLYHTKKVPVKVICKFLQVTYRHAYNVANKPAPKLSCICPVCGK